MNYIIAKFLEKTHRIWSPFLKSSYKAYDLPTGGKVYIDITESAVMFARVTGNFEPEKHQALDYFLQKGDAYIDIGANKGEFAIHAALAVGEEGKVVAFEPEPTNCKWIKKSIEASGVSNIVLEESALGDKEDSLVLYIGELSGLHSLAKSEKNLNKDSITVNVYPLDKYLAENPLPKLKAIKIDVEGFEEQVLTGAMNTLDQHDDLILFIDIHPDHGVKHATIYDILTTHGFSLFKEQYPFNIPISREEKPLEILAVKKKQA